MAEKIVDTEAEIQRKFANERANRRQAQIVPDNTTPITTTTSTNTSPTTTTTNLRNFLQNTPSVRVESTITERKAIDVSNLQEKYARFKQLHPIYRATDVNPTAIPIKSNYESPIYDKTQIQAQGRDLSKDVATRITKLIEERDLAKSAQDQLVNDIRKYEDKMKLLQENFETSEALRKTLEIDNDRITNENKALTNDLRMIKYDYNQLVNESKLKDKEIANLTSNNRELNAKVLELTAMLEDVFRQISR